MGSFSAWHWLIVLAIVVILFGRGKIPELMGDVAQGIRAFKKGIDDEATSKKDRDGTNTVGS
ncbi:sec-independent protein translocase protein TatA [Rhizobium sp. BK529]|uniref:twin-arginine translocase TatA/TatE family subunit n=1 Tax=unclassified Rhizobium TaxID=2613769 RepID=UPI0010521BC7|nr:MULTISPECIES: twin-arginine translocase TatA/TatE family subunit [unclassified Rhizobium]MBB3593791.1 sec-independent protein translocase protein TatA [Rhizobium sp. BK529]TCR95990.1 sec-independent protein translocase protein TatA [Rhizobium sp. BK418]